MFQLKGENSDKFKKNNAKKAKSNILTSIVKESFTYLWLDFTKILIFCYFNLKYYI